MLERIRKPNQSRLGPRGADEAQSKGDIRPGLDQGPALVALDGRVGGVEAHGHGDDGGADEGGEARGKVGGEDEGVEAVVREEAEDALGAGDFEVDEVGGPEVGGGVVEAEGEGLVPDAGVAVGVVLGGEGVGEVRDVLEVVDVVWIGGEFGEVFAWEVGDEVGAQDDVGGVAVVVLVEGVGGDVCVVDDGGARVFDGEDGGFEGGGDGGVGFLGGVEEVARDPDAFAAEAGEIAGCDVVGRGAEGLGHGVVVERVFAGDGLENVGGIFDGARHGAHGVLTLADRDDQRAGGQSDCGFDADKIVHFAGAQDAAACLQ